MSLGFKMGASGEKPRTETYNVTENGTFDMGENNLYRYVNVNVATGKSVIITDITSDTTINYADYGITIPDGYAPLIIPIPTYLGSGVVNPPTVYFETTPTRTSANIKVVNANSNNKVNILLTTIKAKSWGNLYRNADISDRTSFTVDVPINKLIVVPITFSYLLHTNIRSLSSTQTRYDMNGVTGYSGSTTIRNAMYYEIE